MLRNTHEVVGSGKYKYVVFIDTKTGKEEFIKTDDEHSEFETY
jgi:hypothetical protein